MKIGNITSKTQILYIVLASAIFCALVFSYIRQVNIDEREHLYSSFMVYRGFLPYKDFFQHHHPLLWYAFAPFLIFFNNTPYIWYVMRVFNLFVLLLTGYYTSKITYNITQNKPTSIITAIIYLNFPHVLMSDRKSVV